MELTAPPVSPENSADPWASLPPYQHELPSLGGLSEWGETYHDLMPAILKDYCDVAWWRLGRTFPPFPDRHPILTRFGGTTPWSRVVKRDAAKAVKVGKALQYRGEDGTFLRERVVTGHVWIDHDPLAILLSRHVIRTCQTLDNTAHGYQAANIAHAYNPFLALVCAGPQHPRDASKVAESPVTGRMFIPDGAPPARLRPHQATANLFLMADEKDRPYVVLGRIYDACAEYPWGRTLVRFLMTRARRLGIGVAVTINMNNDKNDQAVRDVARLRAFGRYEMRVLRTPRFTLPTGRRCPDLYNGDGSIYQAGYDAGTPEGYTGWHCVQANAVIALEPAPDVPPLGMEMISLSRLTSFWPLCASDQEEEVDGNGGDEDDLYGDDYGELEDDNVVPEDPFTLFAAHEHQLFHRITNNIDITTLINTVSATT